MEDWGRKNSPGLSLPLPPLKNSIAEGKTGEDVVCGGVLLGAMKGRSLRKHIGFRIYPTQVLGATDKFYKETQSADLGDWTICGRREKSEKISPCFWCVLLC